MTFGQSSVFFIVQLINIALIGVWLLLSFKALKHLSNSILSISTRLLWVLMIIFVPVLGAALYILTMKEIGALTQSSKMPEKSI